MQYLGMAFLVLLAMEILSIIWVAKMIGGLATIGLMILCFMFGSFLMQRSAGLSKLMLAGGILRNGGVSLYQMLYPIRIPVAAFFLMMPGFFLDLVAIFLLLPIGGKPTENIFSGSQNQSFGDFYTKKQNDDDDVIDGDFIVKDGKRQSLPSEKY